MLTPRKALSAAALVLLCCALLGQRWTAWLTRPMTNIVDTAQWPAGWVASRLKPETAVDYPEMSDTDLQDQLAAERKWNDELWQENAALREQLEAFQAIIEVRPLDSIRLVEATVSNYNADPVNPSMKLLRGSLHGLARNDAVAYRSNLLGFVTEVGPTTATASLITRRGFEIEVNIMPPEGVRSGQGWPITDRVVFDGEDGFVCVLDQDIASYLRPGDIVRVSDTLRESANGFVIGVIETIEPDLDSPHLLSRVSIRPRTPIGPQRRVTVLTERTD